MIRFIPAAAVDSQSARAHLPGLSTSDRAYAFDCPDRGELIEVNLDAPFPSSLTQWGEGFAVWIDDHQPQGRELIPILTAYSDGYSGVQGTDYIPQSQL